ncbi:MAG: L-fucose isomerase, partial [Candidatus Aminicenantes bacterium]|nr:L-fucose isomerase [Candidatus Aminicenantes bacterium]
MKKNPEKRLIGTTPKIGIRPVIDGRRKGVRESLEGQTFKMAENAAKFLSANLKHANGLPVEC